MSRSRWSVSEGEVSSGDEEKARISTKASAARDSRVNTSSRTHHGSSSRASPLHGLMNDPHYHFRDDNGTVRDAGEAFLRDRSRSRSPYRASQGARGDKRRHEDDHYNRKSGSDPRRFKVHYEGGNATRDRNGSTRARRRDSRSRSRSPFRAGQQNQRRDRSRSPYRPGKTQTNGQHKDKSQTHESENERRQGAGLTPKNADLQTTSLQAEMCVLLWHLDCIPSLTISVAKK